MSDNHAESSEVPLLTETNYTMWKSLMLAYLSVRGLRHTVDGTYAPPQAPTGPSATPLSASERAELLQWNRDTAKTCGILFFKISPNIRATVQGEHDSGDAAGMWSALAKIGTSAKASTRTFALGALLSARMLEKETPLSFHSRVTRLYAEWNSMLPDQKAYTFDQFKSELVCWTTLRGLPTQYDQVYHNLIQASDTNPLSMDSLRSAFQHEHQQKESRENDPIHVAMRARAPQSPASVSEAPEGAPKPTLSEDDALRAFASATGQSRCWICDSPDHLIPDCPRKGEIRDKAAQDRKKRNNKGKKKQEKEKTAPSAPTANATTTTGPGSSAAALAAAVQAANASVFSDYRLPLAALSVNEGQASADWNTDTGCTTHMTPRRDFFRSYSPHRQAIWLADNSCIYSEGVGSVEFKPVIDGVESAMIVFHDVLHVPKLATNLLSVFDLMRCKGYTLLGQGDTLGFFHTGGLRFTATVNEQRVGYLNGSTVLQDVRYANAATTRDLDYFLWHERFSHISVDSIKQMHRHGSVTNMELKSNRSPDRICEPCIAGKQHRHKVPQGPAKRATEILGLVHSDLKGPLPRSHDGFTYKINFVDDKSRKRVEVFLKKKSDAFPAFLAYKAWAENATGKKIKVFRDDKGGEYISKEWNDYMRREGIERQHTETAEPHQNGVAERANRDCIEHAISLLNQAKLPAIFWTDAVRTYTHTYNRSSCSALEASQTPNGVFYGVSPHVEYLRVFGCLAYVLVRRENRGALDSHTRKTIFVGYAQGKKAWRFWDPAARVFVESSHAIFDERCFPGNSPATIATLSDDQAVEDAPPEGETYPVISGDEDDGGNKLLTEEVLPEEPPPVPPPVDLPFPPHGNDFPPPPAAVQPPQPAAEQRERPVRAGRHQGSYKAPDLRKTSQYPVARPVDRATFRDVPPIVPSDSEGGDSSDEAPEDDGNGGHDALHTLSFKAVVQAGLEFMLDHDEYLTLDDALEFAFNCRQSTLKAGSKDGEPSSMREVMQRPEPERKRWIDAAHEELHSLVENGTFEYCLLPPGRKAIGNRWVFKVKRNADGSVERYKARLVAQGFSQRPGFDYSETFAPTPKWASLRAVLAIAAIEDLELDSVDISSAFLNGTLTEEVYMKQPEGFNFRGPEWVLRLLRSLYGLKQASLIWHETLNKALTEMGFTRVLVDQSVWVYSREDARIIVPVFVDDMTIATKSKAASARVREELGKRFKLRDLGPTSWLLGVEVIRDRNKRILSLSQRQYALDVLKRLGMEDCSPVTTPMEPGLRLSTTMCPQSEKERTEMAEVPYLSAVGSLAYLAVATRPDIAYAVGVLARFSSNPGLQHWKACKHLLRYVAGTTDMRLTFAPPA